MGGSSTRTKLYTGAAALGLVFASTGVALSSTVAFAADASTVFTYTGASQKFVVPTNVCSVTIAALGAQGGAGAPANHGEGPELEGADAPPPVIFPGGLGGSATSTVAVTPGETLTVNVGGQGAPGAKPQYGGDGPSTAGPGGAGGWNGGANGGDGTWGGGGGGGGGASDVQQGGTSLSNRIVVAGGGGGTGGYVGDSEYDPQPIGGVGGNPATKGGDGLSDPAEASIAGGGGPGTSTSGGAGGTGSVAVGQDPIPPQNGLPGLAGTGGVGASDVALASFAGGGGGGGGLFGGGGGGIGYYPGGGGGGGYSLGDSSAAGVRSGDGQVTITAVTGTCKAPPTTSTTSTTSTTIPQPTTRCRS